MKIINKNVSCLECLFILQLLLVTACSPEENRPEENHTADWPLYGRDYSNQRFSPLKQINLENINQLKLAWHYQTGKKAPSKPTPIVVDNTMIITTPFNDVIALDAESGKQLWRSLVRGMVDLMPSMRKQKVTLAISSRLRCQCTSCKLCNQW
ncbi:MAG: hypothetical protein V3R41_06050 [Gammaproteobacteria bacterium]